MSTERTAKEAPARPPRRRLSPQDRTEQILNVAAQLILDEGLTEFSMERLGRDAGVSKALIYNYFPNQTDLLRALLEREIVQLHERGTHVIASSAGFPDMLRQTTRMYINYIATRGTLLQRLWQEPAVAGAVADANLESNGETKRYFVKQVRKQYGLPLHVAIAAVDMQMAMTDSAAQHLHSSGNNIELATDICVRLLLGGLDALALVYQEQLAPAKKPAIEKAAPAQPAPKKTPPARPAASKTRD